MWYLRLTAIEKKRIIKILNKITVEIHCIKYIQLGNNYVISCNNIFQCNKCALYICNTHKTYFLFLSLCLLFTHNQHFSFKYQVISAYCLIMAVSLATNHNSSPQAVWEIIKGNTTQTTFSRISCLFNNHLRMGQLTL